MKLYYLNATLLSEDAFSALLLCDAAGKGSRGRYRDFLRLGRGNGDGNV